MLMTHDAASGYLTSEINPVYAWTRTQPASSTAFTKQLDCGTRGFDLRAHVNSKGQLIFHHGDVEVGHDAEAAMEEVVAWANKNQAMEDLVVIYNWDCTGSDCNAKMSQALAKAGIAAVSDCSIVAGLNVGTAAAKGALSGGGHVLVLQGCVDQNYDANLACSGFDGPGMSNDLSVDKDPCTQLPTNSTFDEQQACGEKLRDQLPDSPAYNLSARRSPLLGYYSCWEGGVNRDFAVNRLLDSLTKVAAKTPNGHLQEIQSIWQESVPSVVIGVAHLSSLLNDEKKSGLNALMAEKIKAGVFEHISYFEVNNVCDNGPQLLDALRTHHSRKIQANRMALSRAIAGSSVLV